MSISMQTPTHATFAQRSCLPVVMRMVIRFAFVLILNRLDKNKKKKQPMILVMAVIKPWTTVWVAENEVISF